MTIFYKLLVKTLFTLTIFVLLVQAESAQYRPTEFCYYANAAKTELVVAAGQGVRLSAENGKIASKFITKPLTTHQVLSSLFKSARLHFDHYIFAQYKSIQNSFTPNLNLTWLLQKNNIWHRSSDESHLSLA